MMGLLALRQWLLLQEGNIQDMLKEQITQTFSAQPITLSKMDNYVLSICSNASIQDFFTVQLATKTRNKKENIVKPKTTEKTRATYAAVQFFFYLQVGEVRQSYYKDALEEVCIP